METTRGHLGLYTKTLFLYTTNLVFQNISFYSKRPRERNRHTVKPITTATTGC